MNPFMGNNGYGYQRPKFGDSLKTFFNQKTVVNYLIIANIAVWLLVALCGVVMWLFKMEGMNPIVSFLALPASLNQLAMRPWTVLTFMVLHKGFWMLFLNLWMLYFGGVIFVQFLSQKQLAWTYALGGIFGALFFVGAYNIFPALKEISETSFVMGASASTLAVIVAAAAYNPDYELRLLLFGGIKYKWLAVILVVIDIMTIDAANPGTQIAHLGGAAYGFVYGLLLRKDIFMGVKSHSKKRKDSFEYTSYEEVREEPCPRSDEEYNQQKAQRERDVDAILDKISQNGYASLTDEEKAFLFKNR